MVLGSPGEDSLVTASQAAALLGIRVQTVHYHLAMQPSAPRSVGKMGNARVFVWGELRDFLLEFRNPRKAHQRRD